MDPLLPVPASPPQPSRCSPALSWVSELSGEPPPAVCLHVVMCPGVLSLLTLSPPQPFGSSPALSWVSEPSGDLPAVRLHVLVCGRCCAPLAPPSSPRLCSLVRSLPFPLLPCELVHQYHCSRFRMCASICDTYFSLSDLLHSVY